MQEVYKEEVACWVLRGSPTLDTAPVDAATPPTVQSEEWVRGILETILDAWNGRVVRRYG